MDLAPWSIPRLVCDGDAGDFDTEGNLVIQGRRNRMFISGGENICPEIIENLLLSCEGVRRAVVVGVPSPDFGMRPVAFLAGSASIPLGQGFSLKSKLESFMFRTPSFLGDKR
jgi:acyl-CoA synthetase (AMP-forming)/AMP-acid ligase II